MSVRGQARTDAKTGSPARAAAILAAAHDLLLRTGSLPLSLPAVGKAIGASRALVYGYFADGDALARAVLETQLAALDADGLDAASRSGTLVERVVACADIYVRHVATQGPILHIILREPGQLRLDRDALRLPRAAMRRLGRLACVELSIPPRDALALLELLLAIPEEAGRLAHRGELDLDDARRTCTRLIGSGIESVRPNGRGPA